MSVEFNSMKHCSSIKLRKVICLLVLCRALLRCFAASSAWRNWGTPVFALTVRSSAALAAYEWVSLLIRQAWNGDTNCLDIVQRTRCVSLSLTALVDRAESPVSTLSVRACWPISVAFSHTSCSIFIKRLIWMYNQERSYLLMRDPWSVNSLSGHLSFLLYWM